MSNKDLPSWIYQPNFEEVLVNIIERRKAHFEKLGVKEKKTRLKDYPSIRDMKRHIRETKEDRSLLLNQEMKIRAAEITSREDLSPQQKREYVDRGIVISESGFVLAEVPKEPIDDEKKKSKKVNHISNEEFRVMTENLIETFSK